MNLGNFTIKAAEAFQSAQQIAFNAKFLIEMLSAADTEEVIIELSTPTKAGIIKPTEPDADEDLLMLVMPLMLNN